MPQSHHIKTNNSKNAERPTPKRFQILTSSRASTRPSDENSIRPKHSSHASIIPDNACLKKQCYPCWVDRSGSTKWIHLLIRSWLGNLGAGAYIRSFHRASECQSHPAIRRRICFLMHCLPSTFQGWTLDLFVFIYFSLKQRWRPPGFCLSSLQAKWIVTMSFTSSWVTVKG